MSGDELFKRANEIAAKYSLKAEFLGDAHSVGVRGDERAYLPVVVLIGVFPGWDVLEKVSLEITNTLEIGRVTYEFARKLESGEVIVSKNQVDHTRGLCGQPDVPNDTPREKVEKNRAHCLCCGTEMYIRDPESIGMQQLGVYFLVCSSCPPPPLKMPVT